ncbi:hypothetical protein [Acerihabitans sp.]
MADPRLGLVMYPFFAMVFHRAVVALIFMYRFRVVFITGMGICQRRKRQG